MAFCKGDMSDLVERLRDRKAIVIGGLFDAIPTMNEAAAEIESLRERLEFDALRALAVTSTDSVIAR